MCRITIAHSIRHRISSASLSLGAIPLSQLTHITIVDNFDGLATSPGCDLPESQENS
jgi:hypothetical protein